MHLTNCGLFIYLNQAAFPREITPSSSFGVKEGWLWKGEPWLVTTSPGSFFDI